MARSRPAALVLAIVLGVGVAHAAPTAAERETARRLMDEGKARLKASDYPRAIEAIQKANDIMHVPTTGLALARAQLAAGHLVEARDVAISVERMPREEKEPAVFETARKQARELDVQLKPRIPTLRLRIKGSAAKIAIDDADIPLSIVGEPIAVNPGKRSVVVTGTDGGEARGEIELAERETKELELVIAMTEAPAKIAIAPPAPRSSVDERQHGERTPLATGLVYGGLGIGLVGLGVGAVTGAMTLSKASKVEPDCANHVCAPSAKSDLDLAKMLGTISTIGFAVGGLGVAAGIAGLLLPRRARVAWLGPGGIRGTF